jgi:nucleotide-binding universal stress UspA family protein
VKALELPVRIDVRNILFATDFSEASELPLAWAAALARRYHSHVVVAHIVPPDAYQFVTPDMLELTFNHAEESAYDRAERVLARFPEVPRRAVVRHGVVWNEIADLIAHNDIDLLVIGTHGRTGFRKAVLGSVAEECIRHVTCPVLTVGPHVAAAPSGEVQLKRVFYATDFSPQSLAPLPLVFSLAHEYAAEVDMLHVVDADERTVQESNFLLAELEDRLRSVLPANAEWSHPPRFECLFGNPADLIVERATMLNADLIALGVRSLQHTFLSTHLPFAVAHKVICTAPCPVLTVRAPHS